MLKWFNRGQTQNIKNELQKSEHSKKTKLKKNEKLNKTQQCNKNQTEAVFYIFVIAREKKAKKVNHQTTTPRSHNTINCNSSPSQLYN